MNGFPRLSQPGSPEVSLPPLRTAILAVLALGLFAACEETIVALVDVASVQVNPSAATVEVADQVVLSAQLRDAEGNVIGGHDVEWTSEEPGIATVDAAGRVTGVASGQTIIRATVDDQTGQSTVTVVRAPSILLSPGSVVLNTNSGATQGPSTQIAVTNGGDAPLEGLSVAVDYAGTATGWLTATLSSTAAPATLSLVTDLDGLDAGRYEATVVVSAERADNGPVSLPVALEIASGPPAAAGNLTAETQSATSILLEWTDDSSGESEFRIERRTSPSTTFAPLATTAANSTSYTDGTVTADNTYFYRVRACGSAGCSAFSNEAQAKTPPNPVSDLTASPVSASEIQISWEDNSSSETEVRVERSTGGAFATIATVAANAVTYRDTGLTPGTSYQYRARACNEGGCSAVSNEDGATTLDLPVPSAPSGLTAAYDAGESAIDLAWSASTSGVLELRLERKEPGAQTFDVIANLQPTVDTYSDEEVSLDGTYVYRIAACGESGCSAYSNEASVTTPPVAPDGLTATAVSSAEEVELAWSDRSSSETGYEVERNDGDGFDRIELLGANTTTYTDTDVEFDAQYSYRVRAINSAGTSGYSNTATVSTPPAAPDELEASAKSPKQIDLEWEDESDTETSYRVEQRTGGSDFEEIAVLGANAESHTVKDLAPATSYTFRVRACSAAGCSPYSGTASATTESVGSPDPASDLTATAEGTTIEVQWADQSGDEDNFRLERDSGAGFELIASPPADAESYSDAGLTADAVFQYRVQACNVGGCSPFSNIDAAATNPLSPSGLDATAIASTSISLSWTDASSTETEYRVEQKAQSASEFTQIDVLPPDATAYAATGLSVETAYEYRVRACNAAGCGGYDTATDATLAIAAPTGLTVTGGSTVSLAWTDNASDEGRYEVERGNSVGEQLTPLATLAAGANSYSDTGVATDTTYTYRVRACNAGGCSSYSNLDSGATPPTAPADLAAEAISGNLIGLSWTDHSSTETGFEIYRSIDGSGFTEIQTVAANTTSFSDATVTGGMTYAYRVEACNAVGCSDPSNIASATTP